MKLKQNKFNKKITLLKKCEKSLKKYSRYLFRYPESKYLGAVTIKSPKLQAMWMVMSLQLMIVGIIVQEKLVVGFSSLYLSCLHIKVYNQYFDN